MTDKNTLRFYKKPSEWVEHWEDDRGNVCGGRMLKGQAYGGGSIWRCDKCNYHIPDKLMKLRKRIDLAWGPRV